MKTLSFKINGKFEPLYKVHKEPKLSKDKSLAVAGDIVMFDGTDKYVLKDLESLEAAKDAGHTPIGVVVIPTSHDVYGDGSAAIMSLKSMRYDTPGTGGANQGIHWGQYNVDISELKNFDVVNTVDASGVLIRTPNSSYIPSTKFTEGTISIDEVSRYNNSPYTPSPYLADGSRNPDYSSIEKSEFNALSDFDGIGNSKVLCDLATAQENWKTDLTIQNQKSSGYSPAACCCWRYSTVSTKQGDWYLPAMGELGYMMARFKEIQSALTKIQTTYSTDLAVLLGESYEYWSSTEYSGNFARFVNAGSGYVNYRLKDNYYVCVRAFLRI